MVFVKLLRPKKRRANIPTTIQNQSADDANTVGFGETKDKRCEGGGRQIFKPLKIFLRKANKNS